ncbi:hypothetical protein HN018_20650 [Lichenicola cladoniae]|uniref:Uncharacterized protein n=1 Tax=Lichenicola cladoniae TaxID=1484109 RepID=A0A6M8HUC6_9PROT|nr:hypothetical protein [Lichenicola cladoniae]NPD69512.1 hypothetical protein [Acetobacteraceae bacterium]QKE92123.1 hypothetical protein HN018_20650 [Lichenicola cladoniae]
MTEIRTLQPHDPLPDGPAIVLMRRFEEEDPIRAMIELIVIHRNQSEETSRLLTEAGEPLPWDDATTLAAGQAKQAGLHHVYHVDRTAGPREREIAEHGGDHSVAMDTLDDDDLEDGVKGSDMRDMKLNEAPRKF